MLFRLGVFGLLLSVCLSVIVVIAKLSGTISVPGYAATVLVVTFFGALNCLGLGVVGRYACRTYENTKTRPNFIVASHEHFGEGQA